MALLEAVRFGPPVTGGWCDRCLLPSLITQEIVGLRDNVEACRFLVNRCVECDTLTARQTSGVHTRIYFRQ